MSAKAVMAEPASVKGWCPGALRPMQTGDGLIVRVRPRCGQLSLEQADGLCAVAARFGNGLIDLTRRANLQIRGVTADRLPALWGELSACGLIDAHSEAESVRNVMISPLSGMDATEVLDVRPIAAALEATLVQTPVLWGLPGKFGFVVDGGGLLPLDGERADVRLRAFDVDGAARIALGIDTAAGVMWLRMLDADGAAAAAAALAEAFVGIAGPVNPRMRMRALDAEGVTLLSRAVSGFGAPATTISGAPRAGVNRVGVVSARGAVAAVGLGAPFGRVSAEALAAVVAAARRQGADGLRLSPWRVMYVPVTDAAAARAIVDAGRASGLVTEADDPVMAIDACPGAPSCRSAFADTRAVARRLAALLPLDGISSVHVSGCAKGCARSAPADLVLVASPAGFGIVRNGSAATPPRAVVEETDLDDLAAVLRTRI